MANSTENLNLSSINFTGEERRASILLNVAELTRKGGLLVGAGFFSIILLMGMSIGTHFSTLSGLLTVMGFATFLSTIVCILTCNLSAKAFDLKREALESVSNSVSVDNNLSQLKKLLEILTTLQKEVQTKEEKR